MQLLYGRKEVQHNFVKIDLQIQKFRQYKIFEKMILFSIF